MKHLFIINPEAAGVKGKARSISQRITLFFQDYPEISYYIHITRWCRDALAFSHHYAASEYLEDADGKIRIHVIGGMGTVYEVINGTTGLPGVQIAIYPYGSTARFLKSFGAGQVNTFYSFYHQVFSETIPLDVMKCGNNFALGLSSTGIGSNPFSVTKKCWREKRLHQKYEITIDGQRIYEECLSILILNAPFNGDKMLKTACQIQPDDGKLDLFIVKRLPHVKLLSQLLHYLLFKYKSYPEFIMHETGRHIQITSKEMQHCRIDGELHYETTMDYRLLPLAIDFVNPLSEGGPSL